jgi:hypothetical protein
MVAASNWFRWGAAIVCVGTLWFAADQLRGDQLSEPWSAPQSPAATEPAATPTATPAAAPPEQLPPPAEHLPAAAQVSGPVIDGVWSSGASWDAGRLGPFGTSHTDAIWLRTDYLLWWTTGSRLPPLVTTSPQGTPIGDAGVLGRPGTTVLFGDESVGRDARSGFRTVLGLWFDDRHHWDVEFDYFSPGGRSASFSETSNGNPIFARPYYDVETPQQRSIVSAYPGTSTGTVAAEARDYFQSFGLNFGYCLCEYRSSDLIIPECLASSEPWFTSFRLDFLAGFRYYGLNDGVTIGEDLVVASYQGYDDVPYATIDDFRARNDFYGGELALRSRFYRGPWSLEILYKIALGNNRRTVNIAGATEYTLPGHATTHLNYGVLAETSNSGDYSRDVFTAIPAMSVQLGYRWDSHWQTFVGYDLIYWNQVYRAADQIDLNNGQSAGVQYPVFPNYTTSFIAQGFNVGAEFRF